MKWIVMFWSKRINIVERQPTEQEKFLPATLLMKVLKFIIYKELKNIKPLQNNLIKK